MGVRKYPDKDLQTQLVMFPEMEKSLLMIEFFTSRPMAQRFPIH